VKSQVQCPIVCIGGINAQNAQQLISEGADMIAVCHSLFSAEDISAQAASFNRFFNSNQE
jgi:thiamine-phosphate pyrophosphorylase